MSGESKLVTKSRLLFPTSWFLTWLVETHRVLFVSSVFNFQRVCEQPLYVRHWDTGAEDSVAKTVPACTEFSVSPGRQMLVT